LGIKNDPTVSQGLNLVIVIRNQKTDKKITMDKNPVQIGGKVVNVPIKEDAPSGSIMITLQLNGHGANGSLTPEEQTKFARLATLIQDVAENDVDADRVRGGVISTINDIVEENLVKQNEEGLTISPFYGNSSAGEEEHKLPGNTKTQNPNRWQDLPYGGKWGPPNGTFYPL
jgi:hypothetical protein